MRQGFIDHYEPGWYIAATASGSGLAQGFLGPCAPGYCWYVERMSSWSNTAATSPKLEVFVQTTSQVAGNFTGTVGDRTGRQDMSLAAANDVSDNASPIVVPEGYYLVAFWSGLNSGDLLLLTTQIAIHLVDFTRPQADFQVREMTAQTADLLPGSDIDRDPEAASPQPAEPVPTPSQVFSPAFLMGDGKAN